MAICQASGSAVATMPALTRPCPQSVMPMPAVLTSSNAFIVDSTAMNRVMSRIWAEIAPVCSSTTSRTYASSSRARAKSFTVRMFV